MINKTKLYLINHRNAIQLLRYCLISVVLLYITWIFDLKYPSLKDHLPQLILLSSDVSSDFLSTLSGVFLTVTTFTFTTILTVLNKQAGSFTPRIAQDFVDRPNVLSLLGMFVGGFFYTVLSLFMIQKIKSETLVISGSLGIFYAIASMISFVLFVLQVLQGVTGGIIVEDYYHRALTLAQEEAEKRKGKKPRITGEYPIEIPIYALNTGYLFHIDAPLIIKTLKDVDGVLYTRKKIGEYVPKGMYVARLALKKPLLLEEKEKNELLGKIGGAFMINRSKNESRDYHHGITILVEIAMTALSPGINDPDTAILCIHKLSQVLGILFSTENTQMVLEENDHFAVIYNSYSVEEEIYMAFNQILFYGKGDPTVSRKILEAIYMIYMISDPSARKPVMKFFNYADQTLREGLETDVDKEVLREVVDDFNENRNRISDHQAMREAKEK